MTNAKEFWLKQITMMVGFSFAVFFLAFRVSLGPLVRHYQSATGFYGQSMMNALLVACVIGVSLAAVTLLLFVLRAGSIAKRLRQPSQEATVMNA